MLKNFFLLLVCIAIPLLIGGLSGYLIIDSLRNWYPTLMKPSFNPPNAVFGPVWTTLYVLMGVSLFMIIKTEPGKQRTKALVIFAIQLFLNFWWSIIFFVFKHPGLALIEVICLWLSIAGMISAFRAMKPAAAYLQIPYILWVTFATVLNAAIWVLN